MTSFENSQKQVSPPGVLVKLGLSLVFFESSPRLLLVNALKRSQTLTANLVENATHTSNEQVGGIQLPS